MCFTLYIDLCIVELLRVQHVKCMGLYGLGCHAVCLHLPQTALLRCQVLAWFLTPRPRLDRTRRFGLGWLDGRVATAGRLGEWFTGFPHAGLVEVAGGPV